MVPEPQADDILAPITASVMIHYPLGALDVLRSAFLCTLYKKSGPQGMDYLDGV